jgi:hypothetical protein
MRAGDVEEADDLVMAAEERPYQTMPAKIAPMASTPSGMVITGGLSWAWSWA